MSLVGQVNLLATRLGTEIKALKAADLTFLKTLTIGTVTTGAAGSQAAATIAGTAPNQTISFTIPQGAQGIQGNTGNAGTAATVAVGTTTTGAAGSSASVTNGGTSSAAVFNFTVPQGAVGNTGPANTLSIGTVTTLAAGASATATISGTAPNQTLSLGIPQGAAGTSPADPSLGTNFSNANLGVIAPASTAFTAANGMYFVPVQLPVAATLTGIKLKKGSSVTTANYIAGLYTSAGTKVANSATAGVAGGATAAVVVTLPFTATYAAAAGLYWVGIIGSSTSADAYMYATTTFLGPSSYAAQASFAVPASFTPPATTAQTAVTAPWVTTY